LEAKPLRLFQLCAPDAVALQLPGLIFWIDTFSPELGNEAFAGGSVKPPLPILGAEFGERMPRLSSCCRWRKGGAYFSTFDPRMAGRNVRFISSAQKDPIIN